MVLVPAVCVMCGLWETPALSPWGSGMNFAFLELHFLCKNNNPLPDQCGVEWAQLVGYNCYKLISRLGSIATKRERLVPRVRFWSRRKWRLSLTVYCMRTCIILGLSHAMYSGFDGITFLES